MISVRPPNIRTESNYTSAPRATTPQPRMRVHPVQRRPTVEEATIEDYEILQNEQIAQADPYIFPDCNNHE
eukprot:4377387-Amphidinium_carterae.1